MTTVFYTLMYGRFIDIQSKLGKKKIHRKDHGSNFLGGNFSNRDKIRDNPVPKRKLTPTS